MSMLRGVLVSALVATGFIADARPVTNGAGAIVAGQAVESEGAAGVASVVVLSRGSWRTRVRTLPDGRFVFADVPAGQYSLSATAAGYVGGGFGQRHPVDLPQTVLIREKENVAGLRLRLWKHALIHGRIDDSQQEPLVGIEIRALREGTWSDGVRFVTAARTVTDDRGEYRLSSLTPGRYLVAAMSLRSQPTGSAVPVFYPGVPAAASATVLALTPGADESVAFSVPELRAYLISGSVEGRLPVEYRRQLSMTPMGLAVIRTDLESREIPVAGDGRFLVTDVPPGQYLFRLADNPVIPGGATASPRQGGYIVYRTPESRGENFPATPDTPGFWAEAAVTVQDRDVPNVELRPRESARIRGRIEFDGSTLKPAPDAFLASAVLAVPVDRPELKTPLYRVEADGRFRTTGLPPGLYRLDLQLAFKGWMSRSVRVANVESLGLPVALGSTDLEVSVVLTDRPNQLSGTVRDANGLIRHDVSVFAFPADKRQWAGYGMFVPGRMKSTRPDRDGRYVLSVLPVGEDYCVVAIAGDVPEAWTSPQVLERLAGLAMRIRIAAYASQEVPLQVRSWPRS